MKIACLGWGSLIWKPGILPLRQCWRRDGPALPIDFVRQADGGELAAVICPGVPQAPVMWTLIDTGSVKTARELLRQREKIPSSQPQCIGSTGLGSAPTQYSQTIARWAAGLRLDAVIWTALPPRFEGENGRVPTAEEALNYLNELTPERRDHAQLYLRSAPMFIKTALRNALEKELGWTPDNHAPRELALRQGAAWPGSSRRRFPPYKRRIG